MTKKQLISTGIWHINKINKLKTLEQKIVFAYLLSNPLTSRSGIYTIYSGGISEGIGRHLISAEKVREVLKELEGVSLIRYEHDEDILYILDFHRYVPFGNGKPTIIASDLLAEFEEFSYGNNQEAKKYWEDYIYKNQTNLIKMEEKLNRPGNKGNPDKITIKSLLILLKSN